MQACAHLRTLVHACGRLCTIVCACARFVRDCAWSRFRLCAQSRSTMHDCAPRVCGFLRACARLCKLLLSCSRLCTPVRACELVNACARLCTLLLACARLNRLRFRLYARLGETVRDCARRLVGFCALCAILRAVRVTFQVLCSDAASEVPLSTNLRVGNRKCAHAFPLCAPVGDEHRETENKQTNKQTV